MYLTRFTSSRRTAASMDSVQASSPLPPQYFANLYFDQNQPNGAGTSVGFEITNSRAFTPGFAGYAALGSGFEFAISADHSAIEFVIPNIYFTAPIAGLTIYPGITYPTVGDNITLGISQSFGYNFVEEPLGTVALTAAVPAVHLGNDDPRFLRRRLCRLPPSQSGHCTSRRLITSPIREREAAFGRSFCLANA